MWILDKDFLDTTDIWVRPDQIESKKPVLPKVEDIFKNADSRRLNIDSEYKKFIETWLKIIEFYNFAKNKIEEKNNLKYINIDLFQEYISKFENNCNKFISKSWFDFVLKNELLELLEEKVFDLKIDLENNSIYKKIENMLTSKDYINQEIADFDRKTDLSIIKNNIQLFSYFQICREIVIDYYKLLNDIDINITEDLINFEENIWEKISKSQLMQWEKELLLKFLKDRIENLSARLSTISKNRDIDFKRKMVKDRVFYIINSYSWEETYSWEEAREYIENYFNKYYRVSAVSISKQEAENILNTYEEDFYNMLLRAPNIDSKRQKILKRNFYDRYKELEKYFFSDEKKWFLWKIFKK